MNRTIKDATVKRYHYESHDQLREHLQSFIMAYNFAKRFKTGSRHMNMSAKSGHRSQSDSI